MHPILHLKSDRANPDQNQPFEHGLGQSGLGGRLAHDHGSQLAVIPHQNNLLGSQTDGNQSLGLHRLRRLVDQHLPESEILESRIAGPDARATNHVRRLQNLPFGTSPQGTILPLIPLGQFADLVLEPLELRVLVPGGQGGHDVQAQVIDGGGGRLAGLGRETHHSQPRRRDLFGQLIHRDVRGGRDQNLTHPLLGQVIHERGGGDSLPGPGRTLNETHGPFQDRRDRLQLTLVETGQTRNLEFLVHFRHLGVRDPLLLDRMSQ
mmetsp:Transcript_17012/g.34921  ORF Transcript_17012/g.34921 Transcript_17012/m.34921 type:complete len:264 (-) Transcript_17012:234-1025(-)